MEYGKMLKLPIRGIPYVPNYISQECEIVRSKHSETLCPEKDRQTTFNLAALLVRFKRRHLYLASAIATVFSLAAFGTTLLFATHLEHWHMEAHAVIIDWSSVVFGCILVFCVNLGVQPMANLMTSELFPAEVRALCKVGPR